MEVVRAACTHPFQIWFSSQVHMACVRQQKGAGEEQPVSCGLTAEKQHRIGFLWFLIDGLFFMLLQQLQCWAIKKDQIMYRRGEKNEGLMCSSAETGSRHFHPCLGRVQMCRFSTWCACNWKQHLGGFWGEAGVNCANRKIKPTLSLWETAADSPCRPRTPVSSPSWLGVQRCHLQAEGLNSLFPWQLHVWMQGVPL